MHRLGRRQTPRYGLSIPFWVRTLDSSQTVMQMVESSNISASGIYFVTDNSFPVGTPVEMFLQMPEAVVEQPPREWRCRGRVVRINPGDLTKTQSGIGVEFQYYEVLKDGIQNAIASDIAYRPVRAPE